MTYKFTCSPDIVILTHHCCWLSYNPPIPSHKSHIVAIGGDKADEAAYDVRLSIFSLAIILDIIAS